ncbi:MAG: hypothetical protein GWP05_11020 [Anaerolineaceae bacterium]|nr:hypothetical protein [Anaerolineaceae bacterium]
MLLADESHMLFERLDWRALVLLLQLLTLGYLAFAFWRIARNQTRLAEYLKKKLEKDD